LSVYPEEISDIFIQCFTTLSIQVPIIATLLAVIFKSDATFPIIVIEKLGSKLLQSLSDDDVQVSKLVLRAIASLSASNCMVLSGPGSINSVLETFLDITESSFVDGKLDYQGQVTAFLISSTLPWIASKLNTDDEGKMVLERSRILLEKVVNDYYSPYEVGGQQAIFHVGIVHATDCDSDSMTDNVAGLTPLGPAGGTCWDTLYEACKVALEVLVSVNKEEFTYPSVMCAPWVHLKEELEVVTKHSMSTLGDSFISNLIALNQTGKIGGRGRFCYPNGSPKGSGSSQWLMPRFPIFDSETCPDCVTCTALTGLEKYTIMGYYRDILQFFDPYLRDDGTRTGSIEVMIAHLLAVSKLLSISENGDIHLEYILLEMMFHMLVQQPHDVLSNSRIFRVILDISKKNVVMAPAVALGMGILYNLLPEMDTSSSHELCR
jgi:hypothetical protein